MTRGRARGTTPAGLLLVDKPAGPTSHDVVDWVRWALQTKQVGHCGTLDPAATGLLLVCVGAATKLASLLTAADKAYRASFTLGSATTTDDAQGEITASAVCPPEVALRAEAVLRDMVGALMLPPPAYSAVHVDGTRAHERARRGETVDLPARSMVVLGVQDVAVVPSDAAVRVDATLTVSKGTYIRSLANELGRRLGVPAHLSALRRVSSGAAQVDDAHVAGPLCAQSLGPAPGGKGERWRIRPVGLQDADRPTQGQWLAARRCAPWTGLPIPVVRLATDTAEASALLARLGHGQAVDADDPGWAGHPPCGDAAVVAATPYQGDHTLILVEAHDGRIHPRRVLGAA